LSRPNAFSILRTNFIFFPLLSLVAQKVALVARSENQPLKAEKGLP